MRDILKIGIVFLVIVSFVAGGWFCYEIGYEDGYGEGYIIGYNSGYEIGYPEGYYIGYPEGYYVGYYEGYEQCATDIEKQLKELLGIAAIFL